MQEVTRQQGYARVGATAGEADNLSIAFAPETCDKDEPASHWLCGDVGHARNRLIRKCLMRTLLIGEIFLHVLRRLSLLLI